LILPGHQDQSGRQRTFAELLIDCKEDRTLGSVIVGMLRETNR
jgi:hypothetical protein